MKTIIYLFMIYFIVTGCGGNNSTNNLDKNISTITNLKKHFAVGYLPSWSIPWFDESSYKSSKIATADKLFSHIVISFAKPDLTFNSNNWDGTGIEFSSDLNDTKKAIELLQQKGVKVLLAVGGASYNNWQSLADEQSKDISHTVHKKALKALIDYLNLDGVDIDYEVEGADSDNITKYYKSVLAIKEAIGNKILTLAAWSTGADCTADTTNSIGCKGRISYYSGNAGRERLLFDKLKENGYNLESLFNYISIMSYDGGVDRFDPISFYNNYQSIYHGPTALGMEIPAEGWGGAELVEKNTEALQCNQTSMITGNSYNKYTIKHPYSIESFINFLKSKPNSGIMLWSIYKNKEGTVNCPKAINYSSFIKAIQNRDYL